jgi:hypothetical protein
VRVAPKVMPTRDRALMGIGATVQQGKAEHHSTTVHEGYATLEDGGFPYVQAFGIRVYYRRSVGS